MKTSTLACLILVSLHSFVAADFPAPEEEELVCDPSLDIDIAVVWAEAVVTLNGKTPPQNEQEEGLITLRNLTSGDVVPLGETSENGGSLDANAIIGSYAAFYSLRNGGSSVPANSAACLGTVVVDGSAPLAIDVPMVTVTGEFLLDGVPTPESELESADIFLRNPHTGDEVFLGNTSDGSYQRNIVPGTYNLVYELAQGGLVMPLNGEHVVALVTIPNAPEIVHTLDVELSSTLIGGGIFFNGEEPPPSTEDFGRIFYRDRVTHDEVLAGSTSSGLYSVRLLTGRYGVYYAAAETEAEAPVNTHARIIEEVIVLDPTQNQDVDIPVISVFATATLNGDSFPPSVLENGEIYLRNLGTGDEALLGLTSENGAHFRRKVIPGQYEVFWDIQNGGALVPRNKHALLGEIALPEDTGLEIDVPMVTFAGEFLLNEHPPPKSVLESAKIYLRNPRTGDEVLLGETKDHSFVVDMVPGDYDVVYELENGGSIVPINALHVIDYITVPDVGDAVVFDEDVKLRVVFVQGDIFVNGSKPPASALETGRILYRDTTAGDEIHVGDTADGSYSANLLVGTYDAFYSIDQGGSFVPLNSHAFLGRKCLEAVKLPNPALVSPAGPILKQKFPLGN